MVNRNCDFSPLYWERYFVGEEVIEIGEDRSTRRQMFWRQMQSFRSTLIYTTQYNINMLFGTICVLKYPVPKVPANQEADRYISSGIKITLLKVFSTSREALQRLWVKKIRTPNLIA